MNLLVNEPASESEISEEKISRLVRRAQERDAEAFGELFDALEAKLHRQAFFLARDEQQALDLLQETMIEAWKHLERFDGRARFFTWLCSIMAHRHYDWIRRVRVRAATLLGQREAREESSVPTPANVTDELERSHALRECLDRLPAKQRTVVYLRFYAGESIEGIAALVKCSVGTVKSRIFHALERLARMQQMKEFQPASTTGEQQWK
ncbi:MAG: RNA polymerase sigma factor [Limisphaerales bacterium]